jgi:hypothetical protein
MPAAGTFRRVPPTCSFTLKQSTATVRITRPRPPSPVTNRLFTITSVPSGNTLESGRGGRVDVGRTEHSLIGWQGAPLLVFGEVGSEGGMIDGELVEAALSLIARSDHVPWRPREIASSTISGRSFHSFILFLLEDFSPVRKTGWKLRWFRSRTRVPVDLGWSMDASIEYCMLLSFVVVWKGRSSQLSTIMLVDMRKPQTAASRRPPSVDCSSSEDGQPARRVAWYWLEDIGRCIRFSPVVLGVSPFSWKAAEWVLTASSQDIHPAMLLVPITDVNQAKFCQ